MFSVHVVIIISGGGVKYVRGDIPGSPLCKKNPACTITYAAVQYTYIMHTKTNYLLCVTIFDRCHATSRATRVLHIVQRT